MTIRSAFAIGFLLALTASCARAAHVATYSDTWDSSSNSAWATSGNWNAANPPNISPPSANGLAVFNTSGSELSVNFGSTGTVNPDGIFFDATSTGGTIYSYTFTGSATFAGQGSNLYSMTGGSSSIDSIAILSSVTMTGTAIETFNAPISFSASEGTVNGIENDASSPGVTLVIGGSSSPTLSLTSGANTKTLVLNGDNTGNNIVSAQITGANGGNAVTVDASAGGNAAGTTVNALPFTAHWSLTNDTNSFTGTVTLDGGTLSVADIGTSAGNASDLGENQDIVFTRSTFNSINYDGVLQYTGSGESTSKTFQITSGKTGDLDLEGSALLTLTGGIDPTSTTTASSTIYLTGTSSNGLITGGVDNNTSTGTLNIAKAGSNTWTIGATGSSANTYSGTTAIYEGTLGLDFSQTSSVTTNILPTSTVLTLAGGELLVTGQGTSGNNSQALTSTSLGAGASTLAISNSVSGNNVLVTLGAITPVTGATLNFVEPSGTGTLSSTNDGFTTTSSNVSNNILGGWATVGANGGTDWASVTSSGLIVALGDTSDGSPGTYTNDAWASADNTTVTTSSGPSSGSTTNSLRFNSGSGGYTITLTGANTITTGGILMTSNVGANTELITGGSFTVSSTAPKTLFLIQNDTSGTLEIASQITGSGIGLTKSGAGTVDLQDTSAANSYTGATVLDGGVLNVTTLANFSTASSIGTGGSSNSAGNLVLNGGILQYTGSMSQSTNRLYTLESNGGGFDASGTGGATVTFSGNMTGSAQDPLTYLTLTGTGTGILSGTVADSTANSGTFFTGIQKTGSGLWQLSGNNTYNGPTQINGGTLEVMNGGTAATSTTVGTGPLGTGGAIDFNGTGSTSATQGVLEYASGVTTDFSGKIAAGTSTNAVDINTNGNAVNFTGSLNSNQSGGLIESDSAGTGTLTLSSAAGNTYGGNTTINSGTLIVTNTSGSGTSIGNVAVNSSGTFGGSGIVAPTGVNKITVASGGDLAPGTGVALTAPTALTVSNASSTTGVLTFSAPTGATATTPQLTFTLASGSTPTQPTGLTFAGASTYVALSSDVTGEVAFNGNYIQLNGLSSAPAGNYLLFQSAASNSAANSDYSGLTLGAAGTGSTPGNLITGISLSNAPGDSLYLYDGDIYVDVQSVPEPSTWALLIFGGVLLAGAEIRRRIEARVRA